MDTVLKVISLMTEGAKDSIIKSVGRFEDYFTNLTISPVKQVDLKTLKRRSKKAQTLDEKINDFETSFRVWGMRYGEILAHGKNGDVVYSPLNVNSLSNVVASTVNDSGFAVLNLINSYVEIIGRLCEDFPNFPYQTDKPHECIPEGDFVKAGIKLILPELRSLEARKQKKVVELFKNAVRNSIAHTYLTGANIFLSLTPEQIILVGTFKHKTAISINPQKLFDCVNEHFTGYVAKLKNQSPSSEVNQLQDRFNDRYPYGLQAGCKNRKKQQVQERTS